MAKGARHVAGPLALVAFESGDLPRRRDDLAAA